MRLPWGGAIVLILGPALLGPALVRASRPTELDIDKLALENEPEQCLDGSFVNFFNDEENWPYLLAALNRCQRPEFYGSVSAGEVSRYNGLLRGIIITLAKGLIDKLTTEGKTYYSLRPLWVSLMSFCHRIEVHPTIEEWKTLIFANPPSDESISDDGDLTHLLLDTVIILEKVFDLWEAVIQSLNNLHTKHQLLMAIYAQGKEVRTVQKREYLATLFDALPFLDDESVYTLPAGFRKRFVKLLLELTVGNPDRQSIIQGYFQTNGGLWIQNLRSGDADSHPNLPKILPMLPNNYEGEVDGWNAMDDYLQFVVTEYENNKLADALKKVSHNAGKALCLSYKSPFMQKRMSVLASIFPSSPPPEGRSRGPQKSNSMIIQEFMAENCKEKYEAQPADLEIPIIGNVRYLRNNSPMDGDLLFVDSILAEANANQEYIPDEPTKTKLDDPKLLAQLYLQLSLRVKSVHAAAGRTVRGPFNVTALLQWIKESLNDSYTTSTRSGAFRTLVLAAVRDDNLGAQYLQVLCSPEKGDYCRDLYEASLRDVLFSNAPSRMVEWKTSIETFGAKVASLTRDCDLSMLYSCKQSIVTPNIGHIVAAVRHLESSADQVLVVKTIGPWIPPTFLQNNYDPEIFSLLLTTSFKGGGLQRIKEYLQLAPATLADTPGMLYGTWVVTHVHAFPARKLTTPLQADIFTNMLRGDQKPTFGDLCQDGRCVLLTKEELAATQNGALLTELKSIRSQHEIKGIIEKKPLNIKEPNQNTSTLADQMAYRWCRAYEEASGPIREEIFKNILDGYIKTLAEHLEFGDYATTVANLTSIIYDQHYLRETAASHFALLKGDLRNMLKAVSQPGSQTLSGTSP